MRTAGAGGGMRVGVRGGGIGDGGGMRTPTWEQVLCALATGGAELTPPCSLGGREICASCAISAELHVRRQGYMLAQFGLTYAPDGYTQFLYLHFLSRPAHARSEATCTFGLA